MESKISVQAELKPRKSCATRLRALMQTNVFQRSALGTFMLSCFVILCKSNKIYIMMFTVLLTLGISYELISLAKRHGRPLSLSGFLICYILAVVYAMNALPSFVSVYSSLESFRLVQRHRDILFYAYAVGLVITILSLRKSKLSSQLLLLTISNAAAYTMGLSCAYAVLNIERGTFYYFYPCILVISNDIFAYIIGKTCGRTPLYALSPNKTIEGFLGASFFTWLVGNLLCYLKVYHGFLPDSMDDIVKEPFRAHVWYLRIPTMFVHNIVFSGFASFFAPFIGFLASAIKRTFKKKDFGAVIPGHGGLTDRMDCQMLMVFFTHFYLNSFFKTRTESVDHLSNYILHNYNRGEIDVLISKLIH